MTTQTELRLIIAAVGTFVLIVTSLGVLAALTNPF
jgi:hypothetical protein